MLHAAWRDDDNPPGDGGGRSGLGMPSKSMKRGGGSSSATTQMQICLRSLTGVHLSPATDPCWLHGRRLEKCSACCGRSTSAKSIHISDSRCAGKAGHWAAAMTHRACARPPPSPVRLDTLHGRTALDGAASPNTWRCCAPDPVRSALHGACGDGSTAYGVHERKFREISASKRRSCCVLGRAGASSVWNVPTPVSGKRIPAGCPRALCAPMCRAGASRWIACR